jgi:hypothetical protein
VAVVPEACADDLVVEGAELLEVDGTLRTLAPEGTGGVEITVQGCSEAEPTGS